MQAPTRSFGTWLVILGLIGFVASGTTAWTALIPAAFGLVILASTLLHPRFPRFGVGLSVTLGVLAFAGSASALFDVVGLVIGAVERPLATASRATMAILSALYLTRIAARCPLPGRRADPSGDAGSAMP